MKNFKIFLVLYFAVYFAADTFCQQISFTADVTSGCYPLTVNFTNTSNAGDFFVWDFGDSSNYFGTDTSHTYILTANYTVKLAAYNAQLQFIGEANLNIKVQGVNFFMVYPNDTVCPDEDFYVGVNDFDSLKWYYSDSTVLKNNWAVHSFSNPGTYEVMLVVYTGCGLDTVIQQITVTDGALPMVPNINFPGTQFCVGDQVQFSTQTLVPSYNYFWDFDDGNFSEEQNPVYSYTSVGFRNISLTVSNVCGNSNSAMRNIDISGNVPANAQFNFNNQSSCPNEPISFNAQAGTDFFWDFGDENTSYSQNSKYLYADTGLYTVTLIVTNGCGNSDTSSQDVSIQYDPTTKPSVHAYFNNKNWDKDTLTICTGEEVAFTSWVNGSGSIAIEWDFGDGTYSTEKDPTHTFTEEGLHLVTLVAVNNCNGSDTVKKWIDSDLNAYPVTNLMTIPNLICPGEKVYFFDDGNRMIGSGYSYSIWFGDGDSLVDISSYTDTIIEVVYHQYLIPGTYVYTFVVSNTCGNTNVLTDTILVQDNIIYPSFYFIENSTEDNGNNSEEDKSGCVGDPVSFIIVGGYSYEWHFDDGTTSTDQVAYHSYADTGTYNAFVVATNACGRIDTIQTLVTISNTNLPFPWFNVSEDQVCAGSQIYFNYSDNSKYSENYTYQWDFEDGSVSSLQNSQHSFAEGGEYNIKLVVTNGCGSDSSYRLIRVLNPKTLFSVSKHIVQENEDIYFINQSQNATTFLWDFGDSTTSEAINPVHSYSTHGMYVVTLTSSNMFGCSSVITDTIYIHNIEIFSDIYQNSCSNIADGHIDVTVTGGFPPYSYQWFHDGILTTTTSQDFSLLDSLSWHGTGPGLYEIFVTDQNGMAQSQSFQIVDPSELTGMFDIVKESCGSDGSITAHITGGTPPYSYLWSDSSTDSLVTGLSSGTYSLTVKDTNGCYYSQSYQLGQVNNGLNIIQDIIISFTSPSCGVNNGSVWVQEVQPAGYGSYQFEWNDPLHQFNDTAINLAAGVYQVTVTDTLTGCMAKTQVALSDMGDVYISGFNAQGPTCFGANNGFAGIQAYSPNTPLTVAWGTNPVQTSGLAQNLTSGFFTVTVTDSLGCKAVSSVTLNDPPKLEINITHNDPLCFGSYDGNATANVTGGTPPYTYHWSNGSPYSTLSNRNANTYYITVTDNNLCTSVSGIVLQNPDEITVSDFIQDVTFFGLSNGSIDILPEGGTPPYTYDWSDGNHTQDIEGLAAGAYSVTVIDANYCTTAGNFVVDQPSLLTVSITALGSTTFCYGDSVALDAGGGFLQYLWSTGETTRIIVAHETGYYTVQCASDSSFGIDSIFISASHPYAYQGLCLVTVDTASGKNVIIWEKPANAGIVTFNLYKETTFAGQYALMESLPYDALSMFTDSSSSPEAHSDRYKISVVDTCGNESDLSGAHKTMHLTVSTGIGVYNLIWENYEGFSFGSYTIYRGNGLNSLLPIGSIQSNLTTYTDYDAIGTYYYQIVVMKNDSCWASSNAKEDSGPFSQSLSNIEDNGIFVSVEDQNKSENSLRVAPNPFSDNTIVYYSNKENKQFDILVSDVTGKIVMAFSNISGNSFELKRSGLRSGVYFIEVRGENIYRQPVVVE